MFCKHGHSMADAYINKRGSAVCRSCQRECVRRNSERKRRERQQQWKDNPPPVREQQAKAGPAERVKQLLSTIAREKAKPRPSTTLLLLYRRGLVMEMWRARV